MVLRGIFYGDDSIALFRRLREDGVQGQGKSLVGLLLQHRERTDRLFVREPGDHTVRRLIVELQEMPMGIDLRRMEIRVIVVFPFTGQHPIHTVINVGPHDQADTSGRCSS